MAQAPMGPAEATPAIRGGHYPFKLGVASGDPTTNTVVLWTRLVPRLFEAGGGMPSRKIPVQWQVASDSGLPPRRAPWLDLGPSGARAFGPCRGQGSQARPRVVLPLQVPRRRLAGRPHQDRSRLHRSWTPRCRWRSRHARRGTTATTPPTGTWPTRTSTSSSTWATTSTSTAIAPNGGLRQHPDRRPVPGSADRSAALAASVRAVQERPRPAARPPAVPVDRDLGRPRGLQRLRQHPDRTTTPTTPTCGPPPTRAGTSTSRCGSAGTRPSRRRGSTEPSTGASSPSSTSSTAASTATCRPAAGARPRRAPRRTTPRSRCSVVSRSAGSTTTSRTPTRAGTSWAAT